MPSMYDQILVQGSPRYRKDNKFIKKDLVPEAVLQTSNLDNVVDENGTVIVDKKSDESKKADQEAVNKPAAQADPTPGDDDASDDDPDNAGEAEDEAVLDNDNPSEEDNSDDSDPDEDPVDDRQDPTAPPAPQVGTEDPDADPVDDDDKPGKKAVPKKRERKVSDEKFVSKVPQSKIGMGFPRKNGKTVDIFDGKTPHTHIKLVDGHTVPLSTESFNTKTEKQISDRLQEMGYDPIDYSRNEALDGTVPEDDDDGSLTDDRP